MPPETDNLKLEELFKADQKDREKIYETPAAAKELRQRDAMRRTMVYEMISHGQVNTNNDLYHAAVILQHGEGAKEFLTAHRLSVMAACNGHRPSRWLAAASLDRFLMSVGMPQVYGTQFEHNGEENKYELRLPIDDARILPFEKKFFGVPAIAERLAQLNAKVRR